MDLDIVTTLSWHTRAPLDASLLARIGCGSRQAVHVKVNPKRTVWAIPLTEGGALSRVYLKHDHPPSWRDRLKRLWRCKAEVEFTAGVRLAEAGVPCVPVLGWAQRKYDSFFLSGEIPSAQPFDAVWRDCAGVPARRRRFLASLAAFQRLLLDRGVAHPDLHVGNVLVCEQADGCEFFLLDLYGVRLSGAPAVFAPRSLLWLTWLLGELTWADVCVFLTECGGAIADRDRFWRDLWRKRAADTAYRWRSHRRRFSRSSSLCDEEVDSAGNWLRLATFPVRSATAAVRDHRHGLANRTGIVKEDRKRCLTRVRAESGSVIVKQFLSVPAYWPWRPDRLCWFNAHRLASHHIPTAGALAWLRGRDGHGYVVFSDQGSRTLYDALKAAATSAARRRLLQEAGTLVARLHLLGICHGDLKIHNFMIPVSPSGAPWPQCLVDVDRVYFQPLRQRTYQRRNLELFLETLQMDFPDVSPLPFLAAYRRFSRVSRADLRAFPVLTGSGGAGEHGNHRTN